MIAKKYNLEKMDQELKDKLSLKHRGLSKTKSTFHVFALAETEGAKHRWGSYTTRYDHTEEYYSVSKTKLNVVEKMIINQEAKYLKELQREIDRMNYEVI